MYNQYPIGYWIMRIAVYTKSSLTGDRLLAFGGDGTMLEAAVRAARADVPLVGVNIGNLGFLTQFDAKVDAKTLAAALECESVTRRMLIECTADGKSYLALNDIVVKSASARPVSIELRVNGQFSDAYRSDGVIVATPTGSTAYSLSLSSRASVKVKRSSLTAPFVNAGGEDFYARLLDKMNRWGSAQSAEVTV